MSCVQINRRGAVRFQGRFPTGHANAPFIARFKSGKSPLRHRRDEIVAIQHGKIEKLARDLNANSVQTDVLGSGSAKTVAKKSGHRIATTTFQLRSEDVSRHRSINHWFFGRNCRFAFASQKRLLDRAPGKHRAFHTLWKFAHAAHDLEIAEIFCAVGFSTRH